VCSLRQDSLSLKSTCLAPMNCQGLTGDMWCKGAYLQGRHRQE
jgi:hypothetical protein